MTTPVQIGSSSYSSDLEPSGSRCWLPQGWEVDRVAAQVMLAVLMVLVLFVAAGTAFDAVGIHTWPMVIKSYYSTCCVW